MALTKCVDCGREVSTSAAACPNCGAPVRGASPPPLPGVPPPLPKPKRRRPWGVIAAVGCCLCVVLLLLLLIRSHAVVPSVSVATQPPSKLQAALTSALQEDLSRNKQELFNKIHFLGDAKSDVIQNVSIQWKGGRPTDNSADLATVTVDHTLYWETLLTSNGYTKLSDTYDCSSGTPRLTDSRIIDTNGLTKEGATKAVINYGAKELTKEVTNYFNSTPAPSPTP